MSVAVVLDFKIVWSKLALVKAPKSIKAFTFFKIGSGSRKYGAGMLEFDW